MYSKYMLYSNHGYETMNLLLNWCDVKSKALKWFNFLWTWTRSVHSSSCNVHCSITHLPVPTISQNISKYLRVIISIVVCLAFYYLLNSFSLYVFVQLLGNVSHYYVYSDSLNNCQAGVSNQCVCSTWLHPIEPLVIQ